MLVFGNETTISHKNHSGNAQLWIFPGLLVSNNANGDALRYISGIRKQDGMLWPVVSRSNNFRNLVWVSITSIHPSGHRGWTEEVLAPLLDQVRKGVRLSGIDYSSVMAVRFVNNSDSILDHCPYSKIMR